jgi:3-hydroxyacyl-CoA dehydrogenase
LQASLINGLEGGFFSPYDYELANTVAQVICAGDVNAGELVSEQWLLKLEREAFIRLAAQPETQARIHHLLAAGKPLRN